MNEQDFDEMCVGCKSYGESCSCCEVFHAYERSRMGKLDF